MKDEGEPCDHFCLNEKTHYECACQFNYELGPDLHSCHPIEEPPFIIGGHNEHPLLYTENFPAHTSPDRTAVHSIDQTSTAKTSMESDMGSDSRETEHQDWFSARVLSDGVKIKNLFMISIHLFELTYVKMSFSIMICVYDEY